MHEKKTIKLLNCKNELFWIYSIISAKILIKFNINIISAVVKS